MNKICSIALTTIAFTTLLLGCASPQEMREIERKRASMTPYQKCVASAKQSAAYCGIGCTGDLFTRYAAEVERRNQCNLRCTVQENIALNSCSYQR